MEQISQTKLLKMVDEYAKGNCTLGILLADVKQYCDYINDKVNEGNRLNAELEIENNLMKGYIGEIYCEYLNAEKDGLKLTDKAIMFKERANDFLKQL